MRATDRTRFPTLPADNRATRHGYGTLGRLLCGHAGGWGRGHGDEPALTERATDEAAHRHHHADQNRHRDRRSHCDGTADVNILRRRGAARAASDGHRAIVRDPGRHRDGIIHRHGIADAHRASAERAITRCPRWYNFVTHVRPDRDDTGDRDRHAHADPADRYNTDHTDKRADA